MNPVYGTRDAAGSPSQPMRTLFLQELLARGVIAPSLVISAAHTPADVERTVEAVDGRARGVREGARVRRRRIPAQPGGAAHVPDVHLMDVSTTAIDGPLVSTPTPHRDDRGWFTRTFDVDVFRSCGLDPDAFVQDSQSRSRLGVIRGMHLLVGSGEAKSVRCSSGRMFDVVVDLRPSSPSFLNREFVELDDDTHRAIYVPWPDPAGLVSEKDRSGESLAAVLTRLRAA